MKREPYSLKDAILNCAFWNNGNPNLDLLICKTCDRFWICKNRPKPKATGLFFQEVKDEIGN